MRTYDVAAYIWPAYSGDDPRAQFFWEEGYGEWQSLKNSVPKFPGHRWPRKPLWGYVNEGDPYVMEMEIEAATSHGVNVFVYDWYWYDRRPFLENCLNNGFLKARNRDKMQFYIMWANHSARYNWNKRICNTPWSAPPIWDGLVDPQEFVRMTDRIIEMYFKQPNYYKINGCPVFSFYFINDLLKSLGGIEGTRKALDDFRERVIKAGFPGLHLQFCSRPERKLNIPEHGVVDMDQFAFFSALGIDSLTGYGNGAVCGTDKPYDETLPVYEKFVKMMEENAPLFFPSVSIGWDNNPRYDERTLMPRIITNVSPENFAKGLTIAKDYLDRHPNQPPLMIINAWNEWTEANYLQPDDIWGYGMLEAVKQVFVK